MATLDRTQLPINSVNDTNLNDNALQQVWCHPIWPVSAGKDGEQGNVRDSLTAANQWDAVTYQAYSGSWLSLATITLTGFKGGHLFLEWSGNSLVYPNFTNTASNITPGNPKYCRLRILVAGVIMAERLGGAQHEHFRIFGGGLLPPGDHPVLLQFRPTTLGVDDALVNSAGDRVMQAHVYASKFLACGRYR